MQLRCRSAGGQPSYWLWHLVWLLRLGSKKLEKIRVERQIGNATLSFETGFLAKQAAGSCLVQYGDTIVLCASATGPSRPGIDFFPLTCDYRERSAAAGKFPGGFMKREGRPTTKETLTARLMDRPIRPMFPEGFNDEVQIQAFVLSSDQANRRRRAGDERGQRGRCASRRCRSRGRSVRSAWATLMANSCRSPRRTTWKSARST